MLIRERRADHRLAGSDRVDPDRALAQELLRLALQVRVRDLFPITRCALCLAAITLQH